MVVDLGTGDGRAVLARATAEPGSLVIGIDAVAGAMAESSRRARRRRLPNTLFAVAAAERPPVELAGRATILTITLPWGSLLAGALARPGHEAASAGIAGLVAPNGRVEIVVSIDPRDGLALPDLAEAEARDELARRWLEHGLTVAEVCPATAEELEAAGSTWARRLFAGNRARPAWRIVLCRPARRPIVDARPSHDTDPDGG